LVYRGLNAETNDNSDYTDIHRDDNSCHTSATRNDSLYRTNVLLFESSCRTTDGINERPVNYGPWLPVGIPYFIRPISLPRFCCSRSSIICPIALTPCRSSDLILHSTSSLNPFRLPLDLISIQFRSTLGLGTDLTWSRAGFSLGLDLLPLDRRTRGRLLFGSPHRRSIDTPMAAHQHA
jgi:hypothetical protein